MSHLTNHGEYTPVTVAAETKARSQTEDARRLAELDAKRTKGPWTISFEGDYTVRGRDGEWLMNDTSHDQTALSQDDADFIVALENAWSAGRLVLASDVGAIATTDALTEEERELYNGVRRVIAEKLTNTAVLVTFGDLLAIIDRLNSRLERAERQLSDAWEDLNRVEDLLGDVESYLRGDEGYENAKPGLLQWIDGYWRAREKRRAKWLR